MNPLAAPCQHTTRITQCSVNGFITPHTPVHTHRLSQGVSKF